MPIYQYKARDNEGRLITGRMDVSSEEELTRRLENFGFFLVSFSLEKTNVFSVDISKFFKKITLRTLYTFTIQLANMLNAGVSILAALHSIREGSKNHKFIAVLEKIIDDLKSGSSFSGALSKHPKIFSQFYINMVELGEASGSLAKMLYSISGYIKKNLEIRRKISGAIVYPIVLLVVGIAIVAYILVYIMPKIVEVFIEEKAALPLPTQILINLSRFLQLYWHYLLLGLIGIFVALRSFNLTTTGRMILDQYKLKIPAVGQVIKKVCVKRFVDGLYLLYTGGLPILKALDIVKATLNNKYLEKTIDALWVHISRGQDLASYLQMTDFFSSDILTMIKSGEESGTLGSVLEKVSEIYNEEINYSIERLISFIEIGIILIMGLVVGFIAISILFPIFSLSRIISTR